ncbi:MAG: rRNA pseudouridine synthase [Clostridia bacterium]|nr:rRNA pseudouridine synthase [Clostridia bacterium]
MRLNKYLAECGIASRRACDKIIEEKRVKVNGKVCGLGTEIDENSDHVTVDGKKVGRVNKFDYYIMNKPKGCVCTVKDDKDRKTVMDYLPPMSARVFPVGRLDYDSEGLLIFTNDGDLANRLTHPRNEVPKTYLVKIEGEVDDKLLDKVRLGVEIDGRTTKKCTIKLIARTHEFTKIHITITEGRNREVRKMFESIGKNVEFLKRIKIGDLSLSGLDRGETRKLTLDEINYLKNV